MTVHIFGSNGMLGTYLKLYLSKWFNVVTYSRDDLEVYNTTENCLLGVLNKNSIKDGDVIINAIGVIKSKIFMINQPEAIFVNSIFPHILSNITIHKKVNLIHISTDCVYNGLLGNYYESSTHDAFDLYGKSKSLGEPFQATTIRTSIIGEEQNKSNSLIEWLKSQKNKTINGYLNHFWNGVTCLELSKIILEVIQKEMFWLGTRHLYSPEIVTKYELVKLISEVYNLNLNVIPYYTENPINRVLKTIYPMEFKIPKLKNQLIELNNFKIFN